MDTYGFSGVGGVVSEYPPRCGVSPAHVVSSGMKGTEQWLVSQDIESVLKYGHSVAFHQTTSRAARDVYFIFQSLMVLSSLPEASH